ncbi:MAG: FAD-binding protein [Trueperaceae bacterium]|nr:FAD-binding protein [Trueperaceae bacterium]
MRDHADPDASAGLRDGLAALLRPDQIDTSPSALGLHARGESWDAIHPPAVVVYPESTEDVRRVMAFAHETRTPVTPVAVNSSLGGHTVPVAGGISLDLTRMDRILEIAADDFLAAVQPGVTYPRLNEALRATGLFFPVDPGAEASLGGMASTNASGTLAVRYGVTRDLLLGLEVVTPPGRVIRTGGRAPKSSSGYALTQLFCGAEGTLGVITELTVRLVPRPEAIMGARAAFADVRGGVGYVTDVIQSGLPVARCELLDAAAIGAIRQHLGLELPAQPTVFLEFHGDDASVRSASELALDLAKEHAATAASRATDPEALSALWRARHQAYYAMVAVNPGMANVITDVAVPISRLAEVIEGALAAAERTGAPSYLIGHAGDGNFHLTLFFPADDAGARARVEAAYGEMVELALAAGGTCTGEHGVGLRKLPYVRAEHGDAVDVMWAIKDALDPGGIMNPGKKLPAREN